MLRNLFSLCLLASCFFCANVFAAPLKKINLLFEDRTFELNFRLNPNLIITAPVQQLAIGQKKIPIISDTIHAEPPLLDIETQFKTVVSETELRTFLEEAALLKSLDAKPVEINFDPKTKKITFSGNPIFEYDIDFDALVLLVNRALEQEIPFVRVPAKKQYSKVIVHPHLAKRGIKEIVAIGESNFRGSSWARRKNIAAGANKMTGALVKKGEIFSFNKQLESVDERFGFVKELVIKGDETVPELGGGVCQVSTTLYRSAFFAGLPIVRRRAHSYSVPYYRPVGIDAAIYLGQLDLRFKNDTPGDILIQSFMQGNNLYFVLYGTKDDRKVFTKGPFISEWKPEPKSKYVPVSSLPPGKKVIDSAGYAGFVARWHRVIEHKGKKKKEVFKSNYRPWPAKGRVGKSLSAPDSSTEKQTQEEAATLDY